MSLAREWWEEALKAVAERSRKPIRHQEMLVVLQELILHLRVQELQLLRRIQEAEVTIRLQRVAGPIVHQVVDLLADLDHILLAERLPVLVATLRVDLLHLPEVTRRVDPLLHQVEAAILQVDLLHQVDHHTHRAQVAPVREAPQEALVVLLEEADKIRY